MDEKLEALQLYRLMKKALQTTGIHELRVILDPEKEELEVWVVTEENAE